MRKQLKWIAALSAAAALASAVLPAAYASPITEDAQEAGIGSEFPSGQAYTTSWRYVGSPQDIARLHPNEWFQTFPDYCPDSHKHQEDEELWYYSDGGQLCTRQLKNIDGDIYYFDTYGHLYRNQFINISGKIYAFDQNGRMLTGLRLIEFSPDNRDQIVQVFDKDEYGNRSDFIGFYTSQVIIPQAQGSREASCTRYFFFGDDGAMKTNKLNVEIDGESFSSYFVKSGSDKGQGFTGVKDGKLYFGGINMGLPKKFTIVIFFKDRQIWQPTMSELLHTTYRPDSIFPDMPQKKATDFDSSRDGTLKNRIDGRSGYGDVDTYYVIDADGKILDNQTFVDQDGIHITLEGGEITRTHE